MKPTAIALKLLGTSTRIFLATAILAFNTGAVFIHSTAIAEDPCSDHQCACSMDGEREICCCSGMKIERSFKGASLVDICIPGSPSYTLFAKPGIQPKVFDSAPPLTAAFTAKSSEIREDARPGYRSLPDKIPIAHS